MGVESEWVKNVVLKTKNVTFFFYWFTLAHFSSWQTASYITALFMPPSMLGTCFVRQVQFYSGSKILVHTILSPTSLLNTEIDLCLDKNGGCHQFAECVKTGPGLVSNSFSLYFWGSLTVHFSLGGKSTTLRVVSNEIIELVQQHPRMQQIFPPHDPLPDLP